MLRRFFTSYHHIRSMDMTLTKNIIKYEIPLELEKYSLGDLKCVYTKQDKIILEYFNKDSKYEEVDLEKYSNLVK